jgi:hypothetical protein
MVSAYHLYQNGALTGGGPQDAGLRKVWLENHQPFSVRVGDQWYSYQGTPMAIPFAMVAGWNEASDEAARTGAGDDPASLLMEQFKGGGVGALKGFASQSFLQGLTQQLAFALDPKVALSAGNVSQYAANTALRYGGALEPTLVCRPCGDGELPGDHDRRHGARRRPSPDRHRDA